MWNYFKKNLFRRQREPGITGKAVTAKFFVSYSYIWEYGRMAGFWAKSTMSWLLYIANFEIIFQDSKNKKTKKYKLVSF
jgi:hypothetical protein